LPTGDPGRTSGNWTSPLSIQWWMHRLTTFCQNHCVKQGVPWASCIERSWWPFMSLQSIEKVSKYHPIFRLYSYCH
jgi:hypothetical protein